MEIIESVSYVLSRVGARIGVYTPAKRSYTKRESRTRMVQPKKTVENETNLESEIINMSEPKIIDMSEPKSTEHVSSSKPLPGAPIIQEGDKMSNDDVFDLGKWSK